MLRSALAAFALCCAAHAQLTVNPGQNLQAAVDAVPDGGWVLIFGGSHPSPLVIQNKSIALVGAAPWSIHDEPGIYPGSRLWPSSGYPTQQAWCIEARGRSEHTLIVHNARLSGRTYASVNNGGGPMRIEGYGSVWIADTIAQGFDSRDLDGRTAVPGIIYSAAGGNMLIERSIVIGGIPSSYFSGSVAYAPNGASGIDSSGAVHLSIALVRGGQGDFVRIDAPFGTMDPNWRPTPYPCPCPGIVGGIGGDAVHSPALFHPGFSILEGGRGAEVKLYIYNGSGFTVVPWGYQPNGRP